MTLEALEVLRKLRRKITIMRHQGGGLPDKAYQELDTWITTETTRLQGELPTPQDFGLANESETDSQSSRSTPVSDSKECKNCGKNNTKDCPPIKGDWCHAKDWEQKKKEKKVERLQRGLAYPDEELNLDYLHTRSE